MKDSNTAERKVGNLVLKIACFWSILFMSSQASAYNFIHFGGRQGRAGVTDSAATWNVGASGGTLNWFFDRDQLTLAQASNAQFNAMKARIQPELDKWGLWIDLSFAEAANKAAADVVIEFETTFDVSGDAVPNQAGQGAAAQQGNVAGNTLQDAEIGLIPSNHWAGDQDDFAYVILHEWGHILGLGDLYLSDHNGIAPGGNFEGEDFIDHGLPSIDPLKTTGKNDNVMQKRGVLELDNDEIAGAQWLWGALGTDSLVTGELQARAANANANETADHHGPNTWHYRGTSSVAAAGGGTTVTIRAEGATAIRDVGPGNWAGQIFADRVVFTSAAGYAGNFEFEIDSPNPEGMIRARIEDNTSTDFTAFPLDNGRQILPSPMVFGPIGNRDFGDAPDSYKTKMASDGPRYSEGELQMLGLSWDAEPDGQPTLLANGDDLSLLGGFPNPLDDEDGVVFGDSWVDVFFNIARPGENDYQLRAWWDLNNSGFFDHPTELSIDDVLTLTPGFYVKRYDLGFDPRNHYSRFRFTWDPVDADVKPWGEYFSPDDVSHGEVEDYPPVPEPTTFLLFLVGVFGAAIYTRCRSKKAG